MPHNIAIYLPKVNVQYPYEDNDIAHILQSRIKDMRANNPHTFRKKLYFYSALNIDNIKNSLLKEKSQTTEARILLIPYNVSQNHRVGVLLEIEEDGKVSRPLYMDSLLLDDEVEPNRALQAEIAKVYPGCILQLHKCLQQLDSDLTSCGAYVIENLLNAARLHGLAGEPPTTKYIRALHLKSLEDNDGEYYATFMPRQRANRATIISPSATNVVPVSDNVDALFQTLHKLNLELENVFFPNTSIDAYRAANECALNEESKQLFRTVCDEHGVLRLQLQDAAHNRRVAKFLPVREWRNDKKGFVLDYALPEGIFVVGGAASYATGMGFSQAWRAFRTAETVMGGVRLGAAAAFNPWTAVPTVALTAASTAGTYEAREFARQIDEALRLSCSTNKNDLKRAIDILNGQFGKGNNANWIFTRVLRWPMTSQDQFDFAHLLLAKLHMALEDTQAVAKYMEVYQTTNNKFIKGMAIVGQINILSQNAAWKLGPDGRAFPENESESMRLLSEKVKLLNSDEFKVIVNQYFHRVLLAYRILFEKTQNREFIKSPRDFAETRIMIDQLRNFRDLHCLRHMEPHGKLAEATFTFVQALCEIFYEEYYKATESTLNNRISENQAESSAKAQAKLLACQRLIDAFRLDNPDYHLTSQGRIIAEIQDFTQKYIFNCKAIYDQRLINHELQMTAQFFMRIRRPLRTEQIEVVVNNSFRDMPNASDSEKEAKNIALSQRYRG